MKKLVSRITIVLFVTLYACYPVHAGVGDVYYCVADKLIIYDEINKRLVPRKRTIKFKFKWTEKYGEDYLEFDDEFAANMLRKNYGMSNVRIDSFTSSDEVIEVFSATENTTYTNASSFTDLLYFNDGSFHWSSFQAHLSSLTLHATCSKF